MKTSKQMFQGMTEEEIAIYLADTHDNLLFFVDDTLPEAIALRKRLVASDAAAWAVHNLELLDEGLDLLLAADRNSQELIVSAMFLLVDSIEGDLDEARKELLGQAGSKRTGYLH